MVAAAAIDPVGRAWGEAAIIRTRPAIKGTENRTMRPWMRVRVVPDPRVLIFVVRITVQMIWNNMWAIGGVRSRVNKITGQTGPARLRFGPVSNRPQFKIQI